MNKVKTRIIEKSMKNVHVFITLWFVWINLLAPLDVNEVQYLLCHLCWYWFLTVCWDIPTYDSVRTSSWLCLAVCVNRKTCLHTFHLPALITLRWEPLLHDLSNLIPLSSQTVLTRLVKPIQCILHHMCTPALANRDSNCTLLIFPNFLP